MGTMLDNMLIKTAIMIWILAIIWDTINAYGGETRIPWHGDQVPKFCLYYTREDLLNLRYSFNEHPKLLSSPSGRINHGWSNRKKKKRGSRGGIRNRIKRRGSRFPLLTVTLSNVRSLQNKMHELAALIKSDSLTSDRPT